MKNLWDLNELDSAVIEEFDISVIPQQNKRLKELGIRSGESIVCLKVSPFGGPRIYQVSGSVFSIAKDIASKISVARAAASSEV